MIGGPRVGAGQGVSDAAKSVRNGGGTGRSRRHVVGQRLVPEHRGRVSPARSFHRTGVARIGMLWPDIGYRHVRHLSLGAPAKEPYAEAANAIPRPDRHPKMSPSVTPIGYRMCVIMLTIP